MHELTAPANRLLAALPENEYRRMLSKLERFDFLLKEVIYRPGDPIDHVYFPESGIISLLTAVEEHSMLEVGIVGDEGFVGLPVFLGIADSNLHALVQGAGTALRMSKTDFLEECGQSGELSRVLRRFVHKLITQISQSAACNRFHSIESRLARWLLMMSDRMKANRFTLTQEFLSNMLGVRREAVSIAATGFRQRQIIDYNRGNLSILSRTELEKAACSCYEILRKDYENF